MGLLSAAKCTSEARLDGKAAIVTGANTGIGKCTASDLYKRGCKVIMACRNIKKGEKARDEIQESLKNVPNVGSLVVKKLDLASTKSIKSFTEDTLRDGSKIHILVNNAGVCWCPKSYTEDGFELQFGTNHLGHFLLTVLLLPVLIGSGPARIVIVSSMSHNVGTINFDNLNSERYYNSFGTYCNSKLANILFAKELARRLKGTAVTVYSLHPGIVNTEINRHFLELYSVPGSELISNWIGVYLLKTAEQGAQTTIHCAVDEKVQNETGLYYADCKEHQSSAKANNTEVAKKLWDVSWNLLNLHDYNPFEWKNQRMCNENIKHSQS